MPDLIAQLDDIIAAGDFLQAFDLAHDYIRKTPDGENAVGDTKLVTIKHRALLALVRSGASDRARDMFDRWRLADAAPCEQILGLRARLYKELASQMAHQSDRAYYLAQAAESYQSAFDLVGGPYLAINAATLLYLTGQQAAGQARAQIAIDLAEEKLAALQAEMRRAGRQAQRQLNEKCYYSLATIAEAKLILGDIAAAENYMAQATKAAGSNYAARATTLRQFDLISPAISSDMNWLDAYRPPAPLHYTGHMFALAGEIPPDQSPTALSDEDCDSLLEQIEAAFDKLRPGAVVGSLAAGSDILCAEVALKRRHNLTIVLPCTLESFSASSIWPYGSSWLTRFNTIIERANHVLYASNSDLPVDSVSASLASEVAMGQALQQAQALATQAHQLAIWDGKKGAQPAGTQHDVARWRATGAAQTIIDFPDVRRKPNQTQASASPEAKAALDEYPRAKRIILFADVQGFSKIRESKLPAFLKNLWGPVNREIDDLAEPPLIRNTWGDALFLVFDELEAGAEAALSIKNCFRKIASTSEIGSNINIRIGLHYGPVWEMRDKVTGKLEVAGRAISMASRIENIALPGYIYVTETFARAIALAAGDVYRCEYVESAWPKNMDADIKLFVLQHMAQQNRT